MPRELQRAARKRTGRAEEHMGRRTRSNGGPRTTRRPTQKRRRTRRQTVPPSGDGNCKSHLMTMLPHHILSDILFEYLDRSSRQLSAISCACTLFRSLSKEAIMSLKLRQDLTRTSNVNLPDFTQSTNLREVDFSHCSKFDDVHLAQLAPLRTRLRVLKLRGTQVSDVGVMSFFLEDEACREWCIAGLQRGATCDANAELLEQSRQCSSSPLEVLDLSATKPHQKKWVTNLSLLATAHACPDIKHLSLSMRSNVTDDFIDQIPLFLTKLTFLDVSNCSITSRGCCQLARSASLRHVDISGCPDSGGQAIRALVTGECDNINANSKDDEQCNRLQRLGLIRERGIVSQLSSIAVRGADGVDAASLDILATTAPHLRTIDLRHYRGNNLENGCLSPVKLTLRKLMQSGVEVALSKDARL